MRLAIFHMLRKHQKRAPHVTFPNSGRSHIYMMTYTWIISIIGASLPTNKSETMKIEIITTKNESLKETGFGTMKACSSVLDSINLMGHSAVLNVSQSIEDLNDVVKRRPDLVVLAVKSTIGTVSGATVI